MTEPDIDVIENCHKCAEELEMTKLLQDCPHCGANDVVACHACAHWEEGEEGECSTCTKGCNFKPGPDTNYRREIEVTLRLDLTDAPHPDDVSAEEIVKEAYIEVDPIEDHGMIQRWPIVKVSEKTEDTTDIEAAAISLAHERYACGDTDIEIDDDTKVSIGEDGAWVQVWVFVDKDTIRTQTEW